jgi:Fe2+ or Zn2+ uptake regulation protein
MDALYQQAFGGARFSEPRFAIARAAQRLSGAFTVDELAAAVRAQDCSAGATATLYRAVALMEQHGFLERVGERDGSGLYAQCAARSHHHHIVCDGCGKTAHAECPLGIAEEPPAAGRADGFVITRHEVTLYGLCPDCAATQTEAC